MLNKIKLILPILLISLTLYPGESKLDGLNTELSLSTYLSAGSEFIGIKGAFLGDYNDNTQLYFSFGLNVMSSGDKSDKI